MNALYDAALVIDESEDPEERRQALQALINSGMAWTLQGRVGREAMDAITEGRCVLGRLSRNDYWGNRLPSRFEVEPGAKGSIEYARAHGWEVAE